MDHLLTNKTYSMFTMIMRSVGNDRPRYGKQKQCPKHAFSKPKDSPNPSTQVYSSQRWSLTDLYSQLLCNRHLNWWQNLLPNLELALIPRRVNQHIPPRRHPPPQPPNPSSSSCPTLMTVSEGQPKVREPDEPGTVAFNVRRTN